MTSEYSCTNDIGRADNNVGVEAAAQAMARLGARLRPPEGARQHGPARTVDV